MLIYIRSAVTAARNHVVRQVWPPGGAGTPAYYLTNHVGGAGRFALRSKVLGSTDLFHPLLEYTRCNRHLSGQFLY